MSATSQIRVCRLTTIVLLVYKYTFPNVESGTQNLERSWDHLLKTPAGFFIAFACSILVLVFIIAGGIFMRLEMQRQQAKRESLDDKSDDVVE